MKNLIPSKMWNQLQFGSNKNLNSIKTWEQQNLVPKKFETKLKLKAIETRSQKKIWYQQSLETTEN